MRARARIGGGRWRVGEGTWEAGAGGRRGRQAGEGENKVSNGVTGQDGQRGCTRPANTLIAPELLVADLARAAAEACAWLERWSVLSTRGSMRSPRERGT